MQLELVLILALLAAAIATVVGASRVWRLGSSLTAAIDRLKGIAADLPDATSGQAASPPQPGSDASPVAAADRLLALEQRNEALVRARDELAGELEALRTQAEHQRHLYLFLRGLLVDQELLGALEAAAAQARIPGSDATARSAAGGDGDEEAPDRSASGAPDPTQDDAHIHAARMARVMVGDLFLYNQPAIGKCSDEAALRAQLASNYRAALETFEGRVPARVLEQRHYLRAEFDRRVRERVSKLGAGASPGKEPRPDAQRRALDPSSVARLMVAKMALENITLVEQGIASGSLREALETPYRALQREYAALVGAPAAAGDEELLELALQRVIGDWDVRNTLDSELERLFSERFS